MNAGVAETGTLHEAFRDNQERLLIHRLRVACWLALAIVPAAYVMDLVVYPNHWLPFLLNRVACTALVLGILVWVNRPRSTRSAHLLAQLLINVLLAYNAFMIMWSNGAMSPYYAGLNLVILGACLLLPWSFKENLSACLAAVGWYFAACAANLLRHDLPEEWFRTFFNNTFLLFSNMAICSTAGYFSAQLRFRDFRLQYELDQNQRALEVSYGELDQNKRALEESYRRLEELDRAKSQFFANISHELRTPLTLILAPLEGLMSRSEVRRNQKILDSLEMMQANALRLLGLINDLLDLVRLDQGRVDLEMEPVDLRFFLPGIVNAVKGAAERAELTMESDLAEGEQLVVHGDKDRLEKIFVNLLFNAVKFTEPGGAITVHAGREDESVVVEVRDTGIGIAEENLASVFGRFWQEDASATRQRAGTGIGLALVKELVELHHGTVSVQSQKGHGSTFRVALPVLDQPVEPAHPEHPPRDAWLADLYRRARFQPAEEPENHRTVDPGRAPRREVRKHDILVVEDQQDMQRFLQAELSDTYNVIVAGDGYTGWELAHQHQPKLVVTDMMLPRMDGVSLCRQLRSSPSLLATKIILLTARADDRTKISALEAGADDFLTKPFSIIELKTRLANLLLTAQLERELQQQNLALEDALRQLKSAETQLVQNARLSALGNLSAGIMHEINNPVNFMLTAVEYLKGCLPPGAEDAREAAHDIQDGLKRVRDIIADLRGFAYGGASVAKTDCDPVKIVRTARRLLAQQIKTEVVLEEKVDSGMLLYGSENQIVQLLINLLQNAVHATDGNPARGRERSVEVRVEAKGGFAEILVRDNGSGIPPEIRDKIFDPFFTTKDVGSGTGLGLSICHTIVKQHGGQIGVRSEVGEFTEFSVRLPLHQPHPENLDPVLS